MDQRNKDVEKLKDYKYGFSTDIENIRAPKGLNEEVIKFISNIKKEPQWMLDFRLKAFNRLKSLKEPNWQKPKYPKIIPCFVSSSLKVVATETESKTASTAIPFNLSCSCRGMPSLL